MTLHVAAVWWLTCLLWSTVWLFIKIGVTDVPPVTFAGLRLAIALVILAPAFVKARRSVAITAVDRRRLAGTGFLLLGVNYALVFWGTQFIPSGATATLQAASPAFALLLGFRRGRMEAMGLLGCAVGMAGVAIMSANQFAISGPAAFAGAVAVAGGAACVAVAYSVVKVQLMHLPPVVILFGQMAAGCVPLLLLGMVVEGSPLEIGWSRRALAALLYLAIAGSLIAFWLNLWLLRRTTAAALLAMSIVEPLIAVVLGWMVLGERLDGLTAIGAAMILLSLRLVAFRREAGGAS